MGNIGDGFSDLAIEQNPDIARLQALARGAAQQAAQVKLPATGFVSTINGEEGAVNIQPGTSSSGVTVNVTNGAGTISIGVTGFGALATVKCRVDPTNDPGMNDDNTQGYAQFSEWINESTPQSWKCLDASAGAAVWAKLAP